MMVDDVQYKDTMMITTIIITEIEATIMDGKILTTIIVNPTILVRIVIGIINKIEVVIMIELHMIGEF